MSDDNQKEFRNLTTTEIEILESLGNSCENWNSITVKDDFAPDRIKNSSFQGKVEIGCFSEQFRIFENIKLPTGIYSSMIVSSQIGDNCSVHNAKYISGCIIEDNVFIFNIDELSVSDNPVFGNGYPLDNGSRNWISVVNESGPRAVLPFHTMETADCFLWAKFRGNDKLLSKFIQFTDKLQKPRMKNMSHRKARIGSFSVIKSCRTIKDSNIGSYCRIDGASRMENISVNSSKENPSFIGEDADLKNGIVGLGAEISHGVTAVDFVLANHSNLKYGANFFNSYLGENSTVSCCEVNSSLILPNHQQHHNNSFLIAALLMGQSNIGAGSTIGSNHNSRSADGEISAGRGFWTALSSSIKHNCSFASFTILAKNDFLHEMIVPIPFSLISLDHDTNYLQIMPAYWFVYNMYALTRNSWKFRQRDQRYDKSVEIESDYLAPDTVEEIFKALGLLEEWVGEYCSSETKISLDLKLNRKELKEKGRKILESGQILTDYLEVHPGILEYSSNPVRILHPERAYKKYKEMIVFYCMKVLCNYSEKHKLKFNDLKRMFNNSKRFDWLNVGGQILRDDDFNKLINDIKEDNISSWKQVHERYRELSSIYADRKADHAYASLLSLYQCDSIDLNIWNDAIDKAKKINSNISEEIRNSRLKDHTNKFRHITFSSKEEGEAVLGDIKENSFLKNAAKEENILEKLMNDLKAD